MKTLHLNLKKKWFDLILSGEKTEEYREIKPHWCNKLLLCRSQKGLFDSEFISLNSKSWESEKELCDYDFSEHLIYQINRDSVKIQDFDTITFSNGMTPPVPRFEIELKNIKIDKGNPEWGAKPSKKYFVLELGKLLNQENI